MNGRKPAIDRFRAIWKLILGAAIILCMLAPSAEAQYEWKPGFGWPGGNGLNRVPYALAVFDDGGGPVLYAGGAFTMADGVAVDRIAKWDGTAWAPLGGGMSGDGVNTAVTALTVFDDGTGPALYAGGSFTTAGDTLASNIAKWDGTTWTPLGSGVDATVFALTVFDDGTGPALYAAGSFFVAGGSVVKYVAKWDGTQWSPLGGGTGGRVRALVVFDDGTGPALYVGGEFVGVPGVMNTLGIARWDGATWTSVGGGMNNVVYALTVLDDGTGPGLYAGGGFTTAGGVITNGIGRWDGATWTPLGSGVNSTVYAFTVFDDGSGTGLYAGGHFTTAGGTFASGIAKWDGTQWSPLGSGTNGDVYGLTVFDDGTGSALYAGGAFNAAGGVPAQFIAKWGAQ
jgi:hypothetical protein